MVGSVLLTAAVLETAARVAVSIKYGNHNQGFWNELTYATFINTRANTRFLQTYASKQDQFRILILGGSAADNMGGSDSTNRWGIPLATYSEKFVPFTKRRIEVINFGQPGHITSQEMVMFALYGVHVKPDLVLVIDGANDIVEITKGMPPGIPYTDQYVQMAMNHPFLNALLEPLRHSQFVNVLIKLQERRVERTIQSRFEGL